MRFARIAASRERPRRISAVSQHRFPPVRDGGPVEELSAVLAQYDDQRLGSHQLYQRLTGSRRLWWRCCREAVQSKPDWLRGTQHDRALEIIRSGEPLGNDGAIFGAAQAASWVSRALVTSGRRLAREVRGPSRTGSQEDISLSAKRPTAGVAASRYPGRMTGWHSQAVPPSLR